MPLRVWIILASKGKGAAEIFQRRRWMPDCFLPCVECLVQTIQVLAFKLRLRKCLPDVGIVRSDGENTPAQLDNCRFVRSVFSHSKLRSQLRNPLVGTQQRFTQAQ